MDDPLRSYYTATSEPRLPVTRRPGTSISRSPPISLITLVAQRFAALATGAAGIATAVFLAILTIRDGADLTAVVDVFADAMHAEVTDGAPGSLVGNRCHAVPIRKVVQWLVTGFPEPRLRMDVAVLGRTARMTGLSTRALSTATSTSC